MSTRLKVINAHLTNKMAVKPPLTTHVLDTSIGSPARNVKLSLHQLNNGKWSLLNESATDDDGRCPNLAAKESIVIPGTYKIRFQTGQYYFQKGVTTFYPYADVVFTISSEGHYHVPLLISPFGYSTYRGS